MNFRTKQSSERNLFLLFADKYKDCSAEFRRKAKMSKWEVILSKVEGVEMTFTLTFKRFTLPSQV